MTNISNFIKERRKALGLSQEKLALLTGYNDRSSIAKIEKGELNLNADKIALMSKALDCSVTELMGIGPQESTVIFNVIGDISAGYGGIAYEQYGADTVEISSHYLNGLDKNEFFVLRVKGQSMYPKYCDGDLVLIKKCSTANNSQVAAVIYDDELGTLKKVEYQSQQNTMRLVPINPNYEPITLKGEELNHCRILGVPRLLIREINE